MTWISSLLLFLLLFLNTLAVDKEKLGFSRERWTLWIHGLWIQPLIFIFIPVICTALALLLLKDRDFIFGVTVASLAPAAFVNPFFARHRGGDVGLALAAVLLSTFLCPFVTVPVLRFSDLAPVFLDARFLLLYLVLLTTLPVGLSWLVTRIWPGWTQRTQSFLPLANSLILATLMFILVGSALLRVPLRLLLDEQFVYLTLIFVFMDFGVFVLARFAARQFLNPEMAESVTLSVACRNFAVSSTLMLIFHPKAALPSAVGLVVHSFFFQWLLFRAREK